MNIQRFAVLLNNAPISTRTSTTRGAIKLALLHASLSSRPIPTSYKQIWIFAHATGFCKEVWLPVMEDLLKTIPPEVGLFAVDSRSHGDSGVLNEAILSKDVNEPTSWTDYGAEIAMLVEHLGRQYNCDRFSGIGHSGGAAAMFHANQEYGVFQNIVGFEPIVFPDFIPGDKKGEPPGLYYAAMKRTSQFASREAAKENFLKKKLFKHWNPAALDAYVNYGIREKTVAEQYESIESAAMPYVLKCTPVQEAKTFLGGEISHKLYAKVGKMTCSLTVIGAGRSYMVQGYQAMVAEHPKVKYIEATNEDHLLVMENPAYSASVIRNALSTQAKL